jgi:hypothetical protein
MSGSLLAALFCTTGAGATDVQGRFVAHVIEMRGPPSNFKVTQTVTTPSATLSLPHGNTSLGVTFQTVHLHINAPAVTPVGLLTGAATIEAGALVDFSAHGGKLPVSSSITGDFAIGNISSTPRLIFAQGLLSSWGGKMEGQPESVQVVIPRQTLPVQRNTTASIGTQGSGNVEVAGVLASRHPTITTARIVAVQTLDVGSGFVANKSSDFSTTVQVFTYYDFQAPPAQALEVTRVVEDCEVRFPGGDWIEATVGMKLTPGSQISTGPDSKLFLLFPDSSVLEVSQMTEVLVNTLLRQGNAYTAQILMKSGEVAAQVNPGKVVTSDFSVATPVATASVRGTAFTMRHVEQPQAKSFIVVKEGSVELDPEGAGLPTLTLGGGQMAQATPGSAFSENVPALEIARRGAGGVLSWPTTTAPVILEFSAALADLPWVGANLPITSAAGRSEAVIPAFAGKGFYRLSFDLSAVAGP